jgi:hypothetical protein
MGMLGTTAFFNRIGPKPPIVEGQSMSALPSDSDINLFGNSERVINLDAEIADRAFDLGVAEQELDRSQVACAPVD